jgi:hypothetical protein
MLRPYFLQHLRNGEFNFQVFWKDLSDVPGLNYTDFQISRVSLKDAVDLVDKSSWDYLNGYNQQVDYGDENQTILDEFFLIYQSDKRLFHLYSYNDYLGDQRESIFMKVNDTFAIRQEESFSHHGIRLKRSIDLYLEVQEVDRAKKQSDAIKYLLDDLKIRLDYATKRIGTEESKFTSKIRCGLTRDKIVSIFYLMLDLKIVSGITKAQLNDLISQFVESTVGEDLSTGEIKKRLSRVYTGKEYDQLVTAWKEFDRGPLNKMADHVKLMTSKSAQ